MITSIITIRNKKPYLETSSVSPPICHVTSHIFIDTAQIIDQNFTGDAGVLESVKAASDIFSPMSGEVTDLNTEVEKNPGLINQDCYGAGRHKNRHNS